MRAEGKVASLESLVEVFPAVATPANPAFHRAGPDESDHVRSVAILRFQVGKGAGNGEQRRGMFIADISGENDGAAGQREPALHKAFHLVERGKVIILLHQVFHLRAESLWVHAVSAIIHGVGIPMVFQGQDVLGAAVALQACVKLLPVGIAQVSCLHVSIGLHAGGDAIAGVAAGQLYGCG